ncbi:hypothetical protein RJ640_030813, partial [Escallonia rubra]
MFSLANMPTTSVVLSTYTTFAASAMLVRTVLNEVQNMTNQLLPKAIQEKIASKLGGLIGNFSPNMSVIIDEYNGITLNEIYEASEIYVRTIISPSVERLKVSKAAQDKDFSVTIGKGEKIVDTFGEIQVTWEIICVETQKTNCDEGYFSSENVERKSVELTFNRKYKEKVLNCYLPHVMEKSRAIKHESKMVKLSSLGNFHGDTDFNHPSTFDTLAMDPALKKEVLDDLNRFVKRRDFYKRVGKAWKRGYLLYGPPGTGKSSLIAAMANYLKFNIYDLELTNLHSNSDLRRLLVSTANRSILVIEDIDCSVELQNRQAGGHNQSETQLTLSGLLNFIDGLWSSCGDERIIVFTTNHRDKLDPALLRPGRMDMHIHMSYCIPAGFRTLASNYLGIKSHDMFSEIEKLVTEVEVTPAEIAEELMKSEEADAALGELVKFLRTKKFEKCESKGEKRKEADEKENGSEGVKVEPVKKLLAIEIVEYSGTSLVVKCILVHKSKQSKGNQVIPKPNFLHIYYLSKFTYSHNMFSLANMPTTSVVLSTYTTFAASAILVRTVLSEVQNMTNQLLPKAVQDKIVWKFGGLIENFSPNTSVIIDEYNGITLNEIYEASEIYVRTIISPSVERLKVSKAAQDKNFSVTIGKGEKIVDTFGEIQVTWEMICVETQKTNCDEGYFPTENVERKSVELTFNRKYKEKVLNCYLPHVMEKSRAIKHESKMVKLSSLGNFHGDTDFNHPSSFDTLAMDPALKKEVLNDLDRFVKRRDFYKRVGKAWKRGYLLYGPPGTGKSSLIAAMANYLKFNIYDLELTSLHSNSDLRQLLVSTANRSILVIEDIDCSVELQNRQAGGYNQSDTQLTLSGLLNFIDGLWSSCGDERIIVFTTNHKDKLDPALLRPGRMDMHIHMSYCTPAGFKTLASNYLGLKSHNMFSEIEKLVTEVEVTPAEIAEELMKSEEADAALGELVKFLRTKKFEKCESKGEKRKEADEKENGSEEIKVEPAKKGKPSHSKAKLPSHLLSFQVRIYSHNMFSLANMPTTSVVLSTYTTFAASAMLVRTVLSEVQNMTNQLLPKGVQDRIVSKLGGLIGNFSPNMSVIIDEYNGITLNEIYEALEIYMHTIISPSVERLKVSKAARDKNFSVTIAQISGTHFQQKVQGKGFEVQSRAIKHESKVVKLSTLGNFYGDTDFNHPSTFDTLAMDPALKKEVLDDLDRFVKRRDFYKRVGKAWKRGYLLNGPPGIVLSCKIGKLEDPTKVKLRTLASNYLGIKSHNTFSEIEKLVTEVEVTPAKIAEELMKSEEADAALGDHVKFLRTKKFEKCESKGEKRKEANEKENGSEEIKVEPAKRLQAKMFSPANTPSAAAVLSAYTAFAASAMLIRTVLNEVRNMINHFIPKRLQEKIISKLEGLLGNLTHEMTLIIDEQSGLTTNQVYEASEIYLTTKITPSIQRLKVSMAPRDKNFSVTINKGEKVIDTFEGIEVKWEMVCVENKRPPKYDDASEHKSFELTFNKKDRDVVLTSYLPYVMEKSKAIKEQNNVVKLFGDRSDGRVSKSINFEHPSTFDTLAMDPILKKELIDDLDRFVKRKDYYKRVGKAWKRGYLLYGPPGTGKSSLIAAMANYLKFNVYDLELQSLRKNSDLRRLLISTENRSIIVIEDIDCSVELQTRQVVGDKDKENVGQLTLSGLLNFIDGLWSSCGDERIIVFTTNHKDKLDPALLRPGRMDMHIHMSYCTPPAFKFLASNYLGIDTHDTFGDIEKLISEVEVTPAEIAEELMKSEEADVSLGGVLKFLRAKKMERTESFISKAPIKIMFSPANAPSAAAVLSAYTAFAASAMLIRTVLNEIRNMINHFIPKRLQEKIISKLEGLLGNLTHEMTLIIDEQSGLTTNQVYEASEIYLTTKITPSVQRLKVSKAPRDKNFSVTINKGEKVVETFEGIEVKWEMVCVENKRPKYDDASEHRSFELTFNKKDRDVVLTSYLPHVMEKSKAIKEQNNVVKLFGDKSDGRHTKSINFEHPSTFDTLAMDPILKKELIDDLDRFVKRKDYYKRVGKAWKRGYLLYGPPGTGKSSLIAAMANYLKFNVYDLELQNLKKNSDLRRLLISTENRSILVIEDIDCSVELQNRQAVGDKDKENVGQLTLSGLLNFIDGLWSSCGDERIIVFTTNHKDKLDPALLRPGRMDMHIHMSYCTPPAFKFLASNYLGIDTHGTFGDIEELISEVEVTPAEIAEELMKGFSQMYAVLTLSHRMREMAFKGKRSSRNKLVLEEEKGGAVEGTMDEGVEDKGGAGAEVDGNEGVAKFAAVDFDDAIAEDLIDLGLTESAMVGCLVVRDWSRIFGDMSQLILEADDSSLRFVGEGNLISWVRSASIVFCECGRRCNEGAVEMAEKIMTMHEHGDLCFPGCEIVTASKLDGLLRGRIKLQDSAAVLSAYTAFVASAMLIRTVLNEVRNMINHFIPKRLQEKIISKLEGLLGNLSPQMTFIIDEQSGLTIDQVYKASEIYLTTRITPAVQRLKVSKAPRDKNFSVTINKGEKVVDTFKGVEVIWEMVCVENKRQKYDGTTEHRSFELTFNKKDMDLVMTSYLPHVMEKSKAIKEENNVAKLFGDRNDGLYYSSSINFEHPSTFDTLAMDPILKKELIDDLDRFVKRKDYYKRVGKAWKRGYLLYGPPGTGKSSLIAAMANYLKFNVYDLDLQNLKKNSDLRRVLISTENRSILVIEDIDCSIELQNRQVVGDKDKENVGQLTLSGLLNFIDGLWSSCGDERIIVFTTNHKDKLDPALLRPGRMDMHIHMSYCTPPAFKFLASNYLGIDSHGTFGDIEELISEVEVTPADIAEELMKSEEADVSLGG